MVARLQTLSATVLTVFGLSLAESDRQGFLQDLYNGRVSKSHVELVLAQHDEDIAWSNPLKSVRTVYCKGGSSCDADAIVLPNVGREGQTFLHHIVNNYDRLSDWTVFSQADKPSDGYVDHKRGGGHLLSGSSFEDYLEPQQDQDSLFLMTSKVHLPTLRHALRSSFKVNPLQIAAKIHSKTGVCPKDEGEDVWGNFREVPQVRHYLERKCGVEESAMSDAVRTFWGDFVQLPMPASEVVHYAQGARFAVSRDRVHQRSKAYYQQLLDAVSSDADPCLNYLFEFVWYYIMGTPTTAPCPFSSDDSAVATVEGRVLQTATAGVSGGVSDGEEEEAKSMTVSMTLEVDEADVANLTSDEGKEKLAEGFANAVSVDSEWVEVEVTVEGRRLASKSVSVTYTITFPEGTSQDDLESVATTLDSSTISESLETSIESATGVTVTVSNVATTQSWETTTTYMNPSTSGSIRSTITSIIAIVAAIMMHGSF
mmetsp:Transcript_4379/g.10373  ORF Transcript_4379/g.10373 Transcript_4379/m.10373 type:complete len:484 (-) Transcript_4379:105-1556(-)